MTTNYVNCFIAVSPDCFAPAGEDPKPGTIAADQLRLMRDAPYTLTSDELMFEVHAARSGLTGEARTEAWAAFQAKSMACLRASALVKRYGWGIHHDAESKVAVFGVETDEYRSLAAKTDIKQTRGMRSSKPVR